ncbi:glycosyltransferase [Hymenobacter wooponensis]|uniref:Streptomycin biosynthesis protein StrF domain-containing protein n=1 Tax=Hymenobacter wooponensis TaxID=1525360 RepID=A0A4Z0MT46_9BACT|nr:glycosyltransferase [Hymenobacter wooponensis]TGD82992.1 hypothetical protein EU557_04225 [Hymenobacter wooponensis]
MISIVICSRDPQTLSDVSQDVEATIGVPYEIIAIDNSQGKYGICAAYNAGAEQSKYDILCFMHEDIKFLTPNWGTIVVRTFQDKSIGAIGVAGSTYVPVAPCPWWETGESNNRTYISHTVEDTIQEKFYKNPNNESLSDVVVLDGVWICTRRRIWQQSPFDEKTFPEFHFYDVDFCSEVYKNHRVCVTFDILIEHFSHGTLNSSWVKNALKYYKKRSKELPLGKTTYSEEEMKLINEALYIKFIYRLKEVSVKRKVIAKYVYNLFLLQPFKKDSLYHVKQLLKR